MHYAPDQVQHEASIVRCFYNRLRYVYTFSFLAACEKQTISKILSILIFVIEHCYCISIVEM